MARVSKFKLKDEVLEKLLTLFFEVVGKKHTEDEFSKTINDLLSPAERIMISKRVAIVYLLSKNIDHRTICDVLKVSTATVAKFSWLTQKSEGLVPTLEKIVKNDKIAQFLEETFNTLFPPGMPGVNWKAAWDRKVSLSRRKQTGI